MKNKFILLLSLILAVSSFTACTNTQTASLTEGTINGVNIERKYAPGEETKSQVTTAETTATTTEETAAVTESQVPTGSSYPEIGPEYLDYVKNIYLDQYSSTMTVGDAMNNYFSDSTMWYYLYDETCMHHVICKGEGNLLDNSTVKVEIWFWVSYKNNVEVIEIYVDGELEPTENMDYLMSTIYAN